MPQYLPRKGIHCVICKRERKVRFEVKYGHNVCTECIKWMVEHPPRGYTEDEMETLIQFAALEEQGYTREQLREFVNQAVAART